jgi:hypothetical protein
VAPRLIADRYELLREVSRAPDATYWQAADTLLDRHVMLEVLRPELADDAAAVERFRQSLRVTARAGSSPHGRLLDGGTTDDDQRLPFAVFEWSDESLSDVAPQPVELAPPARRSKPRRAASRNWALPILLTAVPLAVGIILVSRLLSTSGPSVGTVFAVPAGTIQVGNPIAAQPAPLATPTPVRAAGATPAASVRPASPTPAGERVTVTNTDGIGVALRDAPGGNRLPAKGYDEGETVTVLERRGEWTHIRGDDGREGWVLSVTVPSSR